MVKAKEDESDSMQKTGIWEIVDIPNNVIPIGCKLILNTLRDSKGNINHYKSRLEAKVVPKEEFLSIKPHAFLLKIPFIIIMVLIAQFNLKIHRINVRDAFLDGDFEGEVNMQ